MKSVIGVLALLGILAFPSQLLAGKNDDKGPNENAYEHANENARFKRGDDWKQDKELKLDKTDKAEDKETRHRGQDEDGDEDQDKHEKKKAKSADKATGKKAKKAK